MKIIIAAVFSAFCVSLSMAEDVVSHVRSSVSTVVSFLPAGRRGSPEYLRELRGYLFATNVFTQTDQRFELDADGTARVVKFGWMGERGTNNQHRVCEEVSR